MLKPFQRGSAIPRAALSVLLLLAVAPVLAGCADDDEAVSRDSPDSGRERPVAERPASEVGEPDSGRGEDEASTSGTGIRRGALGATGGAGRTGIRGSSADESAAQMLEILDDTRELGPTMVVWIVDRSPSARPWSEGLLDVIRGYYRDESGRDPEEDSRADLATAVIAYGSEVDYVVNYPGNDPEDIVNALETLPEYDSCREVTFRAIGDALERYLPLRRNRERELLLVVITDEAGSDGDLVETLIEEPQKYAVPIHVLGVPAPFGRTAALDESIEAAAPDVIDGEPAIVQGPETRELQRVHLDFAGDGTRFEFMDSGFGPYALERLVRATGGSYLVVRPSGSGSLISMVSRRQWPFPGVEQFEARSMARYVPEPSDAEAYEARLESNAACRALHQAAQLPRAEVLRNPALDFQAGDEAALNRALSEAQKAAARVQPGIDRLHEALRQGLAAREDLDDPRWEAGFDLAMGRVAAAKVRVDGYNAMLAALKRGQAFADPASTRWVLEPSNEISTGSANENLAARARELLQRVVDDHPGTPWARLAEVELQVPLGWTWTEE